MSESEELIQEIRELIETQHNLFVELVDAFKEIR